MFLVTFWDMYKQKMRTNPSFDWICPHFCCLRGQLPHTERFKPLQVPRLVHLVQQQTLLPLPELRLQPLPWQLR